MSANLGQCGGCGGFFPDGHAACPHCAAAIAPAARPFFDRMRVRALGGALGGGAVAFTLMACYGGAPCDDCYYGPADSGRTDAGREAARPAVGDDDDDDDVQDASLDARSDASDASDAGSDADADAGSR